MSAPCGVIGVFESAEALVEALRATRAAGWRRMDAFAPHPVQDAADLLGARAAPVAWVAIGAGLAGALLAYGTQWWLSVHAYPINVGGRPLHAWPASLPATTIVAILWAAAAALIGMLALNRLPRLAHPVFAVPGFLRASEDRFYLLIDAADPRFSVAAASAALREAGAREVTEVPAS